MLSDRYFLLHSAIILIIKRSLYFKGREWGEDGKERKIYLSSRQKHFPSSLRDFHSLISIDSESDETQILFISSCLNMSHRKQMREKWWQRPSSRWWWSFCSFVANKQILFAYVYVVWVFFIVDVAFFRMRWCIKWRLWVIAFKKRIKQKVHD